MTRINTICVEELHTVHLLAEWRELPRVFTVAKKAEERGIKPSTYNIPISFTLGKGHVKFFTNKLKWLETRYNAICEELVRRGINISYFKIKAENKPCSKEWFNDWTPTKQSHELIRQRIAERIKSNPKKYAKVK